MKGRSLVIALLGGLLLLLAFVFWLGLSGGGKGADRRPMSVLAPPDGSVMKDAAPPANEGDGGFAAIQGTVSDRRVRDELRRRILAGWAQGDSEVAAAARGGKFLPKQASEGGAIDGAYVHEILKTDLVPMAKYCYDELLARDPKAAGKLDIEFTIAGDESVGGIVESAELLGTSSLHDDKLTTCVRESVLTLAFRPPPRGGTVTVKVPIVLAPNEPDR